MIGSAANGASARRMELAAVNINPGGWAVGGARPISTLLGSCVAVCIYDSELGLAGMNHFLLPERGSSKGTESERQPLAGHDAMEVLVDALVDQGARKQCMVAKAFGGGVIVDAISIQIGRRNAEFAREWLGRAGIPLVAADFGGAWARKVICVPATGEAYCRRIAISQTNADSLVQTESDYAAAFVAR